MAASAAFSSVGESSIGSTTNQAKETLSTRGIKQPLATRTLPFPKPSPFSQNLGRSSLPLSSTSLPDDSSISSSVQSSSSIWRSTILPPSSQPPPSWSGPAGSSSSFLLGRPVVLEAKQEAKTKTKNGGGEKEAEPSVRPKKKSRMKPSEITWKTCPSLPDGWKTRIVFWSDREKPLFLSPSGKTLTSRKAVLATMQLIGGYSQEDFEKVKKGSHKRKKKPNNQWVPTKKKGKGKGTIGKVKDTTKGQKKTGNNGEKIAKVESKEGKAKTKATARIVKSTD